MTKVIKLNKNEDIAQVIQRIKSLREREVVFEMEKGSLLLTSSSNLRLMRKTAEVLGKQITLKTDDETGKMIASKAGVTLFGGEKPKLTRVVSKSPSKSKFSDIKGTKKIQTSETPSVERRSMNDYIAKFPGLSTAKKFVPKPSIPPITMPRLSGEKVSRRWNLRMDYSKIFILVAVVLVVAFFALAVLLPQAEITVYARSEPITRDLEITVDKNARAIDATRQIIAGEVITKELTHTKNFETTGTKLVGEKATGSVVIYNFTKNTLTLRASTTTLLINGRKYFFTKDATGIRPTARIGTGEEQEIDRSSLTAPIAIVAENPGENYNMPANQKLVIQNSALGTTAEVYAMNEVPLTGGSAKTVNILSQGDIDRATVQMTEELATLAEEELSKESVGTSKKLLPSGATKEVLAKTANKTVGDETDDFDMTVIGRLTGLAYDDNDVTSLVLEKISSVLTEDKYLLENAKKEATSRFKSVDLEKGSGILSVHFETVAAYRVNDDNLSKLLAGKSATEIKEILLTKPEIDRVDVKFSPFFVNKAPRFNGKVYIKSVLSEI